MAAPGFMFQAIVLGFCWTSWAMPQETLPQSGITGILEAFDSHQVVALAELRACKQQLEFYHALFASSQFPGKAVDVVVEFGNALYQPIIDRYLAGDPVPQTELQKVWRNSTGLFTWDSPVYEQFFAFARSVNLKLPKANRFRILLGDPPVDWDKVASREDLGPYIAHRHDHFARVLVDQVLAKRRKALAITGFFHMMRRNGPSDLEEIVQAASHEKMWLILAGSDVSGGYNDIEPRFAAWPRPGLLVICPSD